MFSGSNVGNLVNIPEADRLGGPSLPAEMEPEVMMMASGRACASFDRDTDEL